MRALWMVMRDFVVAPNLVPEIVMVWKSVLSCSVVYRAVKGLVTAIGGSSH